MKKLNSYVLALLMGGMLFTAACDKENVNPPAVVSENNVPNGRIKITYSVQVVNAVSSVSGGKVAGLAGAVVTITGANGKSTSAPVTEDGIATFTNVSPGTVSGFVKVSGYSSVNFTSDLTPTVAAGDSDQVQFAASKIAVYPKTASVTGRIYGDFDFNGQPTRQTSDLLDNGGVRVIYSAANYDKGTGLGKLTSVTVEPLVVTGTTSAEGTFEITGLYPTEDGSLSARFVMDDFVKQNNGVNFIFRLDPATTNAKVTDIKLYGGAATSLGDLKASQNQ